MIPEITGETTCTHFIGSGALSYPWYNITADEYSETIVWSVAFKDAEAGPDDEPDRVYVLNHEKIMEAVRSLASVFVNRGTWRQLDHTKASVETTRQCCLFLVDPDAADFDAGMADQVMQVAAFGVVVYG